MTDFASPSPAPLAPGGAAATELSLAAQAVAGLPHHVNDSAVYQNQCGYWCQADAVFIPASNAETAIAYYRQRLNAGSIAVGHNQHCDRLRLELSEQKAVVALDAATAQNARLYPLVKFARVELHEAGLIDNREYSALAAADVAPLDTYDELRERADAATARAEALEAEAAGLREKFTEALCGLMTTEGESYADPMAARAYATRLATNSSVRYWAAQLGLVLPAHTERPTAPPSGYEMPELARQCRAAARQIGYGSKPLPPLAAEEFIPGGAPLGSRMPTVGMTPLEDGKIEPSRWPCPGCLATKPAECLGVRCIHCPAPAAPSPGRGDGKEVQGAN